MQQHNQVAQSGRPSRARRPRGACAGQEPLDAHADVSISNLERDSLLCMEGSFPQKRTTPLLENLAEMSRTPELPAADGLSRDLNSADIHIVLDMHQRSSPFDALTRDPRLPGMARQLPAGNAYIHQFRVHDNYGSAAQRLRLAYEFRRLASRVRHAVNTGNQRLAGVRRRQ